MKSKPRSSYLVPLIGKVLGSSGTHAVTAGGNNGTATWQDYIPPIPPPCKLGVMVAGESASFSFMCIVCLEGLLEGGGGLWY